jgi:DNA replication protein DnaC
MLLSILLQEVGLAHKRKFIYTTLADYIDAMLERQRLQKFADDGKPNALAKYQRIEQFLTGVRSAPLLGLDDVGKEHKTASGFAQDEFDQLLRNRHDRGRPTVITTNGDVEKWDIYHESMPAFVKDVFDIVAVAKA